MDVWLRGRLHNVRAKGSSVFAVLRQGSFDTVQACLFKDKEDPETSKRMIKFIGEVGQESIVDVKV